MISARFTMRARVERNVASGADNWGQPVEPDFVVVATIPCFAYTPGSREVMDGDKVAAIQDVRIMVGLKADLRVDDEIAAITTKGGDPIFPGRYRVDGPPQFKHNHIEAPLRKVG